MTLEGERSEFVLDESYSLGKPCCCGLTLPSAVATQSWEKQKNSLASALWTESINMLAHSLAHKIVQNEQLKQWMQCMQCEIFLGNLVLIDSKGLHQG
jgi:hypothetical protein